MHSTQLLVLRPLQINGQGLPHCIKALSFEVHVFRPKLHSRLYLFIAIMAMKAVVFLSCALLAFQALATSISDCPGYVAKNVKHSSSGLTADLSLDGKACNIYGKDLTNLTLSVQYQTGKIA